MTGSEPPFLAPSTAEMYFAVAHIIEWDTDLWRKLSEEEVAQLPSHPPRRTMPLERYRETALTRIAGYERHVELQKAQDDFLQYPFRSILEGFRRGAVHLVRVTDGTTS